MRFFFWATLIIFVIFRVLSSGFEKINTDFGESSNYFKEKISGFYKKNLPEPHASLMSGMVLGIKKGIPYDFWQLLKNSGTAHVVVASGMNVSLLAGFLLGFLALFLKRKKAIAVLLIGIWGYVALTGFDAPIVRAGVMASLAFLAQAFGRLVSAWKVLAITALIMLAIRPEWAFDLGFILSFVATTSLMLFEKGIHDFLKELPGFIKEGFSTSLAAQVGVAPILFVTFGQFNLLSPLINALVLWTVAPITIIAGFSGIIGLLFPEAGRLLLYLAYPLTSWFIWIIWIFS